MDDWLQLALRFLQYVLLLGLFGWIAFRVIGLRAARWLDAESGSNITLVAAGLAPVVSAILMLASIAAMMGQPLLALEWPMIEAMTLSTDMGWAFLLRTALLTAAFAALLVRRGAGGLIAALCFGAALMTLGWSGHAAATEGTLGLVHRISNGVHLLAGSLWLGAIGWFVHLSVVAHRDPEGVPAEELLAVLHGFAPLGVALVGMVSITGLINAQMIFGLENSAATLATAYGLSLMAKVAVVGFMLALGAHNARTSRRSVVESGVTDGDHSVALPILRRSLTRELALGIVVLGLVAVLGMLSPMVME
jgi:putative copper resistance protein D